MEVYARELVKAMLAARPKISLVAFVNRELAGSTDELWGSEVPVEPLPVNARRRTGWVRAEQQYMPRAAARARVDLLHCPASTAPLWGAVPRIVTIHDLIFLHHPQAHTRVNAAGMRILVPLAARRSLRIIAISNATRNDLVDKLSIPEYRIDVVPQGLGTPISPEVASARSLRERWDLGGRRVVLTVSAKRPHKNLARLLEALAILATRTPRSEAPILVMPGYPTAHESELRATAHSLGIRDLVRFPGWVSEPELEGLYALAECFVFPSLYEGFGLPVLEAMRRGVPVACSDRASLPEVAGSAALYFDPERSSSIADAVEQLLDDPAKRDALIDRGHQRTAKFSWEETAEKTLDSYERALADAGRY